MPDWDDPWDDPWVEQDDLSLAKVMFIFSATIVGICAALGLLAALLQMMFPR